ncbi:hypothetical protein MFLO_00890 [Listeria floridensis FSL S10-1187]|uniref:Restriction endonuclease n=1 Tax=Listeria floridensis FSL S10-1187 TaxID=1265817 RepID=A0ABP3B374_9LIST|nr:hypothetical protein [Listeria floridensis]EUJ33752.1 hypothetical protein MFLO_00890 [Listeria floridensis FSL S10-1187]
MSKDNNEFLRNFENRMRQELENDPDNPGLHTNVVSSLRATANIERLGTFVLEENYKVEGKSRPRIIEIYFEFEQMGNKERTIVETVSNREVIGDDIEKLANIRNDLYHFSKAIIYYNGSVSEEALLLSKKINVELKYFDYFKEVSMYVVMQLKTLLPNGPKVEKTTVGDPFWTIMEIIEDGRTTGNYYQQNNKLVLFLSKKQAQKRVEELLSKKWCVFGVSQEHLIVLSRITKTMSNISSNFLIVFPEFMEANRISNNYYPISNEDIIKFYWRG